MQQYIAYWRTGTEQRSNGGVFPSVVWITPTARRAAVLRDVVAAVDPDAQRLFIVLTSDQVSTFIKTTPREEVNP